MMKQDPKICQEIRHPGFTQPCLCQASNEVLGDQILSANILEQATGLKMHTRNQDTQALERFGSQRTLSKVSHHSLGVRENQKLQNFQTLGQNSTCQLMMLIFLITNDFGYLKVICFFWMRDEREAVNLRPGRLGTSFFWLLYTQLDHLCLSCAQALHHKHP